MRRAALGLCASLAAGSLLAACGGGGGEAGSLEDAAQRAAIAAPGMAPDRAGGAARLALAGDRLHPSAAGELAMLDVAVSGGGVERVIETGARQLTAALRLEHLLLTSGSDDVVRVWRPSSGALVGMVRTRRPLVAIAEAAGLPLAVGAEESGALALVDLSEPHRPRILPLPATAGHGRALALGFSQDAAQVLVVRGDGELERFATLGGRPESRQSLLGAVGSSLGGRLSAALLYSEGTDEKLLLAGRSGAIVRLNLQSLRATRLLAAGVAPGRITALAKAPYGELAVGTTGGLVTLASLGAAPTFERGAAVAGVGFDREDQLWVAGPEGVRLHVGLTEAPPPDKRPARGLSVGSGGPVALDGGGAVSVLGPPGSGLALPEGSESPVATFAPGGDLLLAAGTDPNHIESLHEVRPGHGKEEGVEVPNPQVRAYEPGPGWWPQAEEGSGLYVNDIAVDRRFVAAGGQDPTGEAVVLVWDAKNGRPLRRLPLATGGVEPNEPSIVADLALLPGKHLLVAYSTVQQSIVIWSTEDWRLLASLPVGPVGDLDVSPDESTILAVGLSEDEEALNDDEAASKLIFIDTATKQIAEEVLTGDVERAAFSPDGSRLALLGVDGSLRLRDSDGRDELRSPIELDSQPESLAWRPDGALIAVGLKEDGVVLVEPHLGRVSPPLPAERSTAFDLSWSPGGKFLAAVPSVANEETGGYEPQRTQIWGLGAPRLQRRMCELSGGPIGRPEWRNLVASDLPYLSLCRTRVVDGGPVKQAQQVILGSRAFELNGQGWGTPEPSEIFNGGDPSGLLDAITWHGWGGPTAIGTGLNAIFKPSGGYYAKRVKVELRVGGLGNCGIFPAYTSLEVRAPSRPRGPLGPWFSWSGGRSLCSAAS